MSLLDDIKEAGKSLASLTITTAIGEVELDAEKNYQPADGAKVMHTRIGLLDGDILSIIPPEFLNEALTSVREHHLEREKSGIETIHKNIGCLKEIVALVKDLGDGKK